MDEYQDTNQVQNAIFTAVSDGGRKLFMVGDVKQSIYRFRLADPTIFLDKYRRFHDLGTRRRRGRSGQWCSPGTSVPGRRSWRGPTTSFEILCQLNSASWTTPRTRRWRRAPPSRRRETGAVELDLEDLSFLGDQEEGERADRNLLEARWAARRIRALLDGELLMLTEGSGQRPGGAL